MLTPQEVSERAFSKASFGGYNMSQVDEFLDVLTGDYSALFNENTVLKSKMKVLVDKVEEYRATEEAMRKALMTAQQMADDMVKQAEEKKAAILRQAEADARSRTDELSKEVEAEEFRLKKAQDAVAAYVQRVRALMAGEEELLSRLDELSPQAPAADPVAQKASEIDDSVQRLLARAMQPAEEEEVQEEAPSGGAEDTAEFDPVTGVPPKKVPEDTWAGQASRIDFA